jgi:hypothetical protein
MHGMYGVACFWGHVEEIWMDVHVMSDDVMQQLMKVVDM